MSAMNGGDCAMTFVSKIQKLMLAYYYLHQSSEYHYCRHYDLKHYFFYYYRDQSQSHGHGDE